MKPKLTHIGLCVENIETSAAFYKRYVDLDVISQRQENEMRVAWLGNPAVNSTFIIVLLEMEHQQSESPSFHHLGLQVESKEEVDAIAQTAKQDGILIEDPADHGPVAGYLCIVRDPDGNGVEFSYGQEVFKALSSSGAPSSSQT
ncbi:MAG: VOC family protein [Candidatus Hinthialibacter antarcticus]|nr:VOC family protein [Candidatus Hinthialibacter antarcticus]